MINFGYKLKQIVATNLVDIYFPKQIAVPTFGGFQTRKKGRPQSKEILITEEGEKIKEKENSILSCGLFRYIPCTGTKQELNAASTSPPW